MATSSETLEIRTAILHGDMLPLVGLKLIAKMNDLETLSGYFMLKSVFGHQGYRALTFALARLSCFL